MIFVIVGILTSFALAAVALALFYRSLPAKQERRDRPCKRVYRVKPWGLRNERPPEGWYK